MALPAWNDPQLNAGTMIRGALWLVQVVGEGGTFTKEQVRQAFPGISQADRRIRDLRAYGWVILASNEDAALLSEEQRFVKAGAPVWDPEARRDAQADVVTAKDRSAALSNDDFMCTVCGIAGGEDYADDPSQTAVLSAFRCKVVQPAGGEAVQLVTMCKRCRAGAGEPVADAEGLLAEIRGLDDADQRRLARWIDRGRRASSAVDHAWSAYRRMPAETRAEIRAKIG